MLCARAALIIAALVLSAGAIDTLLTRESAPRAQIASAPPAPAASPFEPWAGGGRTPLAASARVAALKLAGVRVAADPAQSGAVLTLESGEQRAFAIGQQVSPGVRLAEVRLTQVWLTVEDGTRVSLALEQVWPDRPSLAAPDVALAELGPESFNIEPGQDHKQAEAAEAAAWLTAVLLDQDVQGAEGWATLAPVPALAAEAGLSEGDRILAVNGADRSSGADVWAAAGRAQIELAVLRSNGERIRIVYMRERG